MAEKLTADEAAAILNKEPSGGNTGGLPPEDGLEILGSDPEEIQTTQGPIYIGPMKMRQINAFIRHSKMFLPLLMEQTKGGEVNLTQLMGLASEDFYAAMGAACDQPAEVMAELYPDEFIKVATKIILVNTDFFLRVLPVALGGAEISVMNALVKMVKDGVGPFSALSAGGTSSPRSGSTPSAKSRSSSRR